MEKLKPCPFCGSNDAFICNIRMPDLTSTWPFAERSVLCPNCGMCVTFGYELKSPNGLTDEEVREANKRTEMEWNRRAKDADPVKHGKWIADKYTKKCSECGSTYWMREGNAWNYCPNCGSKNGGEDE